MFRSFMPLAWEHVSSATQIFNLITGVRIVYPEVEEDEMKAIVRVAIFYLRVVLTSSAVGWY